MAVKPRKIVNLRTMAAITQQYAIPMTTNSRCRNRRFTMSANCLNKKDKLNGCNLIKIQVTQKFQNMGAGVVSNSPGCLKVVRKSLPNVVVMFVVSIYLQAKVKWITFTIIYISVTTNYV